MYFFLLHLHSFFRWIIIFLLIVVCISALLGIINKGPFTRRQALAAKILLISSHCQLLIGTLLYFTSPIITSAFSNFGLVMKNAYLRYWAVEHPAVMLLAIILITIGYLKAKKHPKDSKKNKILIVSCGLALLLILIITPWPFREGIGRALVMAEYSLLKPISLF